MAEAVINRLEVVDIDHQAANRFIVTHGLRQLGLQGIFQMMAVTQAGERVKQGFFEQRVAQTLVGQRQPERFGHQFQIRAGRGIVRRDILEGEQANSLPWAISGTHSALSAWDAGRW